ncbi:MAG TPA: tetratricopeptide repeat protein [Roseiflexaceae bacterium]|nr:tetratricopeptide repeat protein [Roseiflexaceae bacterium]
MAISGGDVLPAEPQRLSQSPLWRLLRDYHEQTGVAAWSSGTLPNHITNNPVLARAYAQVVLGFLRDWRAALDPQQPVYLVEPGAGSGRFGFLFAKIFGQMLASSALADLPWTYVLTDFTEVQLDHYAAHPLLQPLLSRGQLDFARFDASMPHELRLRHSGQTLSPGALRNPLVVLANYCFDALPQDAFAIRGGRLHERLIALAFRPDSPADAGPLERLLIRYADRPVSPDYYGDADLDAILRGYEERLDATSLLMPTTALECVRFFGRVGGGRLLLLAGDKGYVREDALRGRVEPGIAHHGSVSLRVNFHAIGQLVERQGGQMLAYEHNHHSLAICAFLLGDPPSGCPETRLAYDQAFTACSPDDFFLLKDFIERHYGQLSLEQLLAYIRWSGWDATIFLATLPAILELLESATPAHIRDLRRAVKLVWEHFFPIGEAADLPYHLATLLINLGDYGEALPFLEISLRLYGPDAGTFYFMALCHYHGGETEQALARIGQALDLEPEAEPLLELRRQIEA